MQYIGLLIFPLRNLGMTVAFGQRAAAALLRVNEVLSHGAGGADPPTPDARCPTGERVGAVEFDHVAFGYDRRRPGAARLRPAHPGRCVGGRGRRHRRRQEHAGPPARPLLRRAARAPSASTVSTCATSRWPTCATRWRSCSRTRSCSTTPSAPTSRSPGPTRRRPTWRPRPRCRARTTSSSICPRGTTRCSASAATRSAAASASASRSPGRSSPTRGCWCSTMPPARSTRRRSTRSARRCAR